MSASHAPRGLIDRSQQSATRVHSPAWEKGYVNNNTTQGVPARSYFLDETREVRDRLAVYRVFTLCKELRTAAAAREAYVEYMILHCTQI